MIKVKNAEAHAEGMYLSGVGVARQRKVLFYDQFSNSVRSSS